MQNRAIGREEIGSQLKGSISQKTSMLKQQGYQTGYEPEESPRFNEEKAQHNYQQGIGQNKQWGLRNDSSRGQTEKNKISKDYENSHRLQGRIESSSSSDNSFDRELSSRLKLLEAKKHLNQYDSEQKNLSSDTKGFQSNSVQQNQIEKWEVKSDASESILRASRLMEDSVSQGNDESQSSIQGINSRFQNSTLHSRYSFLENDQSKNRIQTQKNALKKNNNNISNDNYEHEISGISEKQNISRTVYNSSNAASKAKNQKILLDNQQSTQSKHNAEWEDTNKQQMSAVSQRSQDQQKYSIKSAQNDQSRQEMQYYSNKQFKQTNLNSQLDKDSIPQHFQINGHDDGEISQILSKEEEEHQDLEISALSQSEVGESFKIGQQGNNKNYQSYQQQQLQQQQNSQPQYLQQQYPKLVTLSQDLEENHNNNLFARPIQQNQSQQQDSSLQKSKQVARHLFLSGESEDTQKYRDSQQKIFKYEGNVYGDVITDKCTVEFLTRHFGSTETIIFDEFLNAVYDDFGELLEFKVEAEQVQFEDTLHQMLTTSNPQMVSLNALHIFTKEANLQERVEEIAEEIKQARNREIERTKEISKASINEQIVEEINILSKTLERKRKNIEIREREVEKREKEIAIKEKEIALKEINFKDILQGELDVMIVSLDEAIKERNIEVVKKATQLEKNFKAKMKILEAKAKEIKTQNTSSSATNDRLKAKIAANEKSTEFLKTKAQEADKKLLVEQEKNTAAQVKIDNLIKKNKELEKRIKEFDGTSQAAASTVRTQQNVFSPDVNSAPLSASQSKRNYQQHQQGETLSPIRSEALDEDQFKMGDATISEIHSAFPNNINNLQLSTNEIEQRSQQWNIPVAKKTISSLSSLQKKTPLGPMGSSTTSSDDEAKVLLSVVYTVINSLKTTLPLMLSLGNQEETSRLNESSIDASILAIKNCSVEIGEIFFPCFNNLVSSLVEIVPSLLTHPCNQKHLYNLIDLMFKTISFKFRYDLFKSENQRSQMKTTILSEEILENTRTLIKTGQDHINEIMMNPKKSSELTFIPQTAFWKRKIKILPKKTTSEKNIFNSSAVQQQIGFQLFANEDVQKEMVSVFRQYLESSDLLLRKSDLQMNSKKDTNKLQNIVTLDTNKPENSASISFENQKFILMSRLNLQLMTLILQVNSKESVYALSSLLQDISGSSENLNDSLRNYLVQQHFVQILVWRMLQSKEDQGLIEQAVHLLLNFASNGSHYRQFIQDVSDNTILAKLIVFYERYCYSREVTEKLTVILQRITIHNYDLKDRLSSKQIAVFKNKLSEAERNKNEDNEFLIQNLQSILKNLEA